MSRRYYFAPATGSVHAAENVEGVHSEAIGSTFIPCVVIDPEDRKQVARLVELLAERGWIATQGHGLRDALRELANPKPAEPTGLGAVVEDADGKWWVRDYERGMRPWRPTEHSPANGRHAPNGLAEQRRGYHSIDAVRVLSEGVQP